MKYNKKLHPEIACNLATKGKTNEEIAEIMGIQISTLYDWKNVHPEFSKSITEGKRVPDEVIEKSLFESAKGYQSIEKHTTTDTTDDGKKIKTEKIIEKSVAPHYPSMSLYLRNRLPDKWRDRIEVDHKVAGIIAQVNLSADDEAHAKKQLQHLFPKKVKK